MPRDARTRCPAFGAPRPLPPAVGSMPTASWPESIDFLLLEVELLSDDADKQNGAEAAGRPERPTPEPPGYFEGESMTRRRAFTVAVQGLGGLAGAAIVLPAVGFAVAPIFHRGKERWEGSARSATSSRTPTARSSSPKPRESATPVRPPPTCAKAPSSSARNRTSSSPSPIAVPT